MGLRAEKLGWEVHGGESGAQVAESFFQDRIPDRQARSCVGDDKVSTKDAVSHLMAHQGAPNQNRRAIINYHSEYIEQVNKLLEVTLLRKHWRAHVLQCRIDCFMDELILPTMK